ncbi:MAG: molybdopterin-synthase adenylyltransferase MoeB [Prevotella sp.]|jgi:adenylyltransferase/sulfurtransferase|nr:molybdopterin-synthase adenylyltransferase MoeB [Prevotella sp.]MBR4268879.1 molybdopterin-synthase adenylyltransferase MoeB [Prevotella sp.]
MNREQSRRYSRHLLLDGFGLEGQQRLLDARVLIVGMGGLGSPIALYLAAAGVGTLGLVDGDTVSLTNLQRQIIHGTPDVGRSKVDSAAESIIRVNPEVKVEKHELFLNEDNALDIIRDYDFVVEGSDNFSAKYLVNDACVMLGKPFCIGGINRYAGQVMTHRPGTACYRCLFPEPPAREDVETCAMVGVLGTIAGMLGTIQATEVVKCIVGVGEPLYNQLLTFDALSMQWNKLSFQHNEDCPLCGSHPTITRLREYAYKPCAKTE